MNRNLLLDWLATNQEQMESTGYRVALNKNDQSRSCTSIDIDGRGVVGTVCFWPPDDFEFGFNSAASGKEVTLESKKFREQDELTRYLAHLLSSLDEALNN